MQGNMRGILNEFTDGLRQYGQDCPEMMQGFMDMLHPTFQEGAVSVKEKEFIAVALAVYTGNQHCIAYHVHKAMECGANRNEIIEAASVAIPFGGGPALSHIITQVQDAVMDFSQAGMKK